ncbi:MAG: hypothetical protein U5O16_00150 [Rhodococcus sp. (in: high G+C Gram-positive bacteria)]|uniref:hypothetical protein n=1 Tax=Rhodococcus sp. TaxID=1831 RepID=UPI002AD75BCF|nr:hypothetical protein [Rhodococcus sp. (in: high G+C Gram-positive bacteria)]
MTHSDLPDTWLDALQRLAHDLGVRQYGGDVEFIDWVAEYESDSGMVWLFSAVTVAGGSRGRLACSGIGASVDDDMELALLSMADLVQNEVAEAGIAWPWGDDGGFMRPELNNGVAVWKDKHFHVTRIGNLSEKD